MCIGILDVYTLIMRKMYRTKVKTKNKSIITLEICFGFNRPPEQIFFTC